MGVIHVIGSCLVSPSIAFKEVLFAAAWVSDGSTSKYQTRNVLTTPTNSQNESLPLALADSRGKRKHQWEGFISAVCWVV